MHQVLNPDAKLIHREDVSSKEVGGDYSAKATKTSLGG